MNRIKDQDLEFALSLVEMTLRELEACSNLKKLEVKLRKRWHPDRAIGLGLDQLQIDRYTRISQKIPTCIELFKRYQSEIKEKRKRKAKVKQKPVEPPKKVTLLERLAQLVQMGKEEEANKLAAVSFVKAALRNDQNLIKQLLNFGVDIDGGYTSFPPLCFVVKENNLEMTAFLLSLGASPNVEMDARRVLTYALDNKNPELVECLLKAGADPNRFNSHFPIKWTLLMDRIAKDDLSLIKLLVKYGADINEVSFYPGWSPLLEAVKSERIDIVEFLLESGADATYVNKEGTTVQRLAGKLGNKELIKLFQDHFNNESVKEA